MHIFTAISKFVFTALLLILVTTPSVAGVKSANANFPQWTGKARIAGVEVYAGMSESDVAAILDRLIAQNVSVVNADSSFSLYTPKDQFDEELEFIKRFVGSAHQRGLRVVWYYPVLRVLTQNGKTGVRSMYQDHPDWVQQGLGQKPSVFYGGDENVHWLDKDMESAWMTIQSPYTEYLIDRLAQIAKAGVDGLWLDAPLLSDIETQWADTNPYAISKFKSDTGLDVPKEENWDDPVWRRWIAWRSEETTQFLKRIAAEIHKIAPMSAVIVENVTIDNNNATLLALDGVTMKAWNDVIQVWEIDAVSDSRAMENAKLDDWIIFILMNKFANAASGVKPSWVFSYGYGIDDAELAQAVALSTGNHPYETRIPEMATTVDDAFRSRSYEWIKTNLPQLFESKSEANIGVLFSRHSRDHMGQGLGSGLYATWQSDDPLWWTTEKQDSIYSQTYLAEYRGIAKWLSQSHIPFDIIVSPDEDELKHYKFVIAPALTAVSADDFHKLRNYAEGGGQLIITGEAPLSLNAFGDEQLLSSLLGSNLPKPTKTDKVSILKLNDGALTFLKQSVGADYIKNGGKEGVEKLRGLLGKLESPVQVTSNAPIHVELKRHRETMLLHLINIPDGSGVSGLKSAAVKIDWHLPESSCQPHISRSSLTEEEKDLDFDRKGDDVRFAVQIDRHAMLQLACHTIQKQRSNHQPVAQDDILKGVINRPLLIHPSDLTGNDGDLDEDPLKVRIVPAQNRLRGDLIPNTDGNWLYRPPKDFAGAQTFAYEIDDGHGGKDQAAVKIEIGPEILTAYPGKLEVEVGKADSKSLTNLTKVDDKTLDIVSAPDEIYLATKWIVHTPVQNPSHIQKLVFEYSGQYSHDGVTQTILIYNHAKKKWDEIDAREVGTGDDSIVSVIFDNNIKKYIGSDKNISVQFYAHRQGLPFSLWANAVSWNIVKRN